MNRTSNDTRTPREPASLATRGRWSHDNRRTVSGIWGGVIAGHHYDETDPPVAPTSSRRRETETSNVELEL